jgi:hypothetical protein
MPSTRTQVSFILVRVSKLSTKVSHPDAERLQYRPLNDVSGILKSVKENGRKNQIFPRLKGLQRYKSTH